MARQRRQSILAAVCAVLAALAVFGYTASVKSEAATQRAAAIDRYGGQTAQVAVATADIPVGHRADETNTEMREWLVDLLPDSEVATSLDQVRGKTAQVDIKRGEPLLLARVGNGTSRISVPEGLAAVTVAADDVLAVGGAIKAGSFVNVYVETTKGTVELLGENILVLETSNGAQENDDQVTWVTLAVTPESVSELISASTKGVVHFALPGTRATEGGDVR